MIRRTMEVRNEQERLAAEPAGAKIRELQALADVAPTVKVLAAIEQ